MTKGTSMEDLIAQIQERTGLPADKVLEVVTIVSDFLKEQLPDELIQQITVYLSEAAGKATDVAGTAGSAASSATTGAATAAVDVAGKMVEAAGTVISKAVDTVTGSSQPD